MRKCGKCENEEFLISTFITFPTFAHYTISFS
jgi:hypothetical protein